MPVGGKRDFRILVPKSEFNDSLDYVVFYSKFGGEEYSGTYDLDADPTNGDNGTITGYFPNNDGCEEWATYSPEGYVPP